MTLVTNEPGTYYFNETLSPVGFNPRYRETESPDNANIVYEIVGGDKDYFFQSGNDFILGGGASAQYFPNGIDFDHPPGNRFSLTLKITSYFYNPDIGDIDSNEASGSFSIIIQDLPPPSLSVYEPGGIYDNITVKEGSAAFQGVYPLPGTEIYRGFGASSNAFVRNTDGAGPLTFRLLATDGPFELYDAGPSNGHWFRPTAGANIQLGPDGTAQYHTVVEVSDGTTAKTGNITINVTNVAPTAASDADATGNVTVNNTVYAGFVAENAAVGTRVGITASAFDPGARPLTYAIQGTGTGLAIDAGTGVVTVADPALFDYEAARSKTFGVTASDGFLTSSATFALAIGDVNEAPEIQVGVGTIFDGTENRVRVPGFIPTFDRDATRDSVTLSVSGTDGALFEIVDGELTFKTAPNFEAPGDADRDNLYDVVLVATDNLGASSSKAVQVRVTDANEAPVFTTERFQVASGSTGIGRIQATDPDRGDSLVFSIDPDDFQAQGRFLVGRDGTASFFSPKTYDAANPANNIYSLPVVVTDRENGGGFTVAKTIAVEIVAPGTPPTTNPPATDTLDYSAETARVEVNLATDVASGDSIGTRSVPGFLNVIGTRFNDRLIGDAGDNSLSGGESRDILIGGRGTNHLDGGAGIDTTVFDFRFTEAGVARTADGTIVITGPETFTYLTSVEELVFRDGVIQLGDGSPLVDDLFYYAQNKDVYRAGVDADTHYAEYGWKEGRDPNAFFSTTGYLASNADVRAAGINTLTHYDQYGWKEGRDPAANFDNELYLSHNADVKAAGIDPLAHYLEYGQAEGRQAYAAIGKAADLNTHPGFDAEYYLLSNSDVARAAIATGGDSFAFAYNHYATYGWHEGRNPNAVFDVKGYLAAYGDVRAANIDPLAHYDTYGWREGRDPSAGFDTRAYEAHYADVAAARIDPMLHYLQYGALEGRSAFGDGHLG